MVIYKVTLTDGLEFLEYNIYYNNIVTNIPQLYDITTSGTTGPATNIPYATLKLGVYVEVPDATSVINIVSTAPFCDYVFSECVRLECCATPTPTPTPSFTPTPTPTPTVEPPTNDCAVCTDEYYDTTYKECGGFSYPVIERRICCTYLNSTGGTKTAPTDVIIGQTGTVVGCGGSGTYSNTVTIPSGSTSGCTIYTSEETDTCGDYGCVTTYIYWSGYEVPSNLCQTGITPTPTLTVTPTPTSTPTSTPTPTPTPTSTPSSPCYCYEIVVTGSTLPPPEGGTIATLDYNDCNGTRTLRAFTVGPGTYKQCIQTVSGVVQWFPEGTEGIDTSYLVIPGVGNCNTGYVCTGYTPSITPTPTLTSTPTPTPTLTSTPTPTPSSTPTPTPTGTPTPTPTSTPSFVALSVYTGNSLTNACNSTTLTTVYYQGTLGVGTILYETASISNPIVPTMYLQYEFDDSIVYVVGTPSPEDGYITSITSCPVITPTPTPSPTPNPEIYEYTGCGRGSDEASACGDAANNRVFFSNCDSGTFGVGCYVYIDTFPNPLTGYNNVFMNSATWDINSSTGVITAYSSEQC